MAAESFRTGRGHCIEGVASGLKSILNTTPYGNLRAVIWFLYTSKYWDSIYVHMKISGTCIFFILNVLNKTSSHDYGRLRTGYYDHDQTRFYCCTTSLIVFLYVVLYLDRHLHFPLYIKSGDIYWIFMELRISKVAYISSVTDRYCVQIYS